MTDGRNFAEEAGEQDEILSRKLFLLRGRLEAGEITLQQFSDMRVDLYDHHAACIRNLNAEYFPEGQ